MRQNVVKKNLKYGFWRLDKERDFEIIDNGGWHFSYLLNAEEIQRKIKTFAHTELDLDKFTNLANINKSIKNGDDIFHRGTSYQKVNIDDDYPDFIKQNKELLIDWIC
jgi:beta-1,4-mannosyl-glycoprotein beta-1,4-N-acetylglucosaminyltransferase